jgi:hypothetical protein
MKTAKTTTTMLKLSALLLPAALLTTIAASDASADPIIFRFHATTIKGTIHVPPASATGPLSSFNCNNIVVGATSLATNPPPSGGSFSSPKWQRSVVATGNFASGTCSYNITVPGGSAFWFTAGGHGNFQCDFVGVLTSGPNPSITVPYGTTKTHDLTVTGLTCEIVH